MKLLLRSRNVREAFRQAVVVGKPHSYHNDTVTLRVNIIYRHHMTTSSSIPSNVSSNIIQKKHNYRNDVTSNENKEEDITITTTTTLKEVPMLPYIGSLLPIYSKTPTLIPSKFLDFFIEMRKRYGNFYKFGFPGLGKGIYGETYVLNDPNEMIKVLRQEKTSRLPYPRGGISALWPLINHLKQTKSILAIGGNNNNNKKKDDNTNNKFDENGFFGRGETWKRLRIFLQVDMLNPQAANAYIPGMVQAAQIASKVAPTYTCNLNKYLNRCAFDMFNSVMFGELTKTVDLTLAEQINIEFCNDAVMSLSKMTDITLSLYDNIACQGLGIKTSNYNAMSDAFTRLHNTSELKYYTFRERYENNYNQLNNLEKNSYLSRAIERQKESTNINEDDLIAIVNIMLTAAVETTSSPMGWNLYHLAINQDVQEKLYNELSNAVKKERHGSITENVLKRSTCPYLHAVIRESHRLTPATPIGMVKENSMDDIKIYDTIIPKNSIFIFDSYSIGVNQDYFFNGDDYDDPMEYKPERWLHNAVEGRKGTKEEILDHPFYKDPFSHGSRKCPGSRVANNEVAILISQLVLDWKITGPSHIKSVKDMDYRLTGSTIPELPKLNFTSRT